MTLLIGGQGDAVVRGAVMAWMMVALPCALASADVTFHVEDGVPVDPYLFG